jgi:hypothetical protein
MKGNGSNVRVHFHRSTSSDLGFRLTNIRISEEHTPCKVVFLYLVQVVDMNITDAEKREILDHLVADCTSPDDGNFRAGQSFLRKPVDQVVPIVTQVHHRGPLIK